MRLASRVESQSRILFDEVFHEIHRASSTRGGGIPSTPDGDSIVAFATAFPIVSIAHCAWRSRGLSPLALNALNRCLFALALPVDFRIGRIESPSEPHGSDPMDGPNERRVRGPRLQIRGRAGGRQRRRYIGPGRVGRARRLPARSAGPKARATCSSLASRQCLSSLHHRQHRGCAVIGRAPRRVRQRRALAGESQPAPPAPPPPWPALCSASAWP